MRQMIDDVVPRTGVERFEGAQNTPVQSASYAAKQGVVRNRLRQGMGEAVDDAAALIILDQEAGRTQ